MDRSILGVLAAEVKRRRCPGCSSPLLEADITACFASPDKVRLRFRCRVCTFEGRGEIELTPEIYEEAARKAHRAERATRLAHPISADEILTVHEVLATWNLGLVEMVARRPGVAGAADPAV